MPGARRPLSRLQSPIQSVSLPSKVKSVEASNNSSSSHNDDKDSVSAGFPSMPSHVHIPDIPIVSSIVFELICFIFSLSSLGLQYINLYKTVWWLPHSYANYAVNFYLIDPYLALFLVIVMSRRLVCCFVKDVLGGPVGSCLYWLAFTIKFITISFVTSVFCWSGYHVLLRHTLVYVLCLTYPLACCLLLYGFDIKEFIIKLQTFYGTFNAATKDTPKHKSKEATSANCLNTHPTHICSYSPEAVREETDSLKSDFNNRLKHVWFNSTLTAYYMALIPLCFAQHVQNQCESCWNTLYYDIWWVGQHVFLVWISSFVMYMVHYLPVKYTDTLHRCALHLGRWIKVEGRNAHVPYNAWSELQVWQQGSLVKHVRGLFKADGFNNSAEPGNSMHYRFYFMFHQPLRVNNTLLFITWSLILGEFYLLIRSVEWSHIISACFLLFYNYYMLFKLMRDRFIMNRAYKDEHLNQTQ